MPWDAPFTLTKDSIRVDAAVTKPTPRNCINRLMMRRRTGWRSTASASSVVKPVPVHAERAWNLAASRDMPDRVSATEAMRTTISEIKSTISRELTAIMVQPRLRHRREAVDNP